MDLYSRSHVLEDVAAQHAAEPQTQPVIQPDRRPIEHLPEPQQRLPFRESLRVHVAEVLRFERHVLWIERHAQHVSRQLAGQRHVELAAVRAAQVELVELVPHDLRTPLSRAVTDELVVEKLQPAAVDFLGLWRWMRHGLRGGGRRIRHMHWTINQQLKMRQRRTQPEDWSFGHSRAPFLEQAWLGCSSARFRISLCEPEPLPPAAFFSGG